MATYRFCPFHDDAFHPNCPQCQEVKAREYRIFNVSTAVILAVIGGLIIWAFSCTVSAQERMPVVRADQLAACNASTPPGAACTWRQLPYCNELMVAGTPCAFSPQLSTGAPPCPDREPGKRMALSFGRVVGVVGPAMISGALYIDSPGIFLAGRWQIIADYAESGTCEAPGPVSVYESSADVACVP